MEGLKPGWYKSKRGWASAVLAVAYFILDHVSRAETANHIYAFLLSAKTWFPRVSPWITPALFVLALVFFELERRKSKKYVAAGQAIDEKLEKLQQDLNRLLNGKPPEQSAVAETKVDLLPAPEAPSVIDGELYRVVSGGKAASAGLVREVYVLQKREEEFKFDADVLLELYAVNTSPDKRFIKDFAGSVEVDGKTIPLVRQTDFDAWEFNDVDYEYCLDMKSGEGHNWDHSQQQPLKPAFKSIPLELNPREPIEGWVHFIAKDVDFMKLSKNLTYKFAFIDSLGEEIQVTKASATKRPGHISVCRKGKAGKPPW